MNKIKYDNKVIIKYKNNTSEKIHRFCLTPTGIEMRNTTSEELQKVLEGDGRDFIVYEKNKRRIIRTYEIKDIILHGKSVLVVDEPERHQCGVWCSIC